MAGPFKMKGSKFYGHGNQSPNKLRPSWIGDKQVSDFEADEEQRRQEGLDEYPEGKEVTRTGGSQVKHLKKTPNPNQLDKDLIKEAREEQAKPENRAAEIKQIELNKANEAKRRKEGTLKDAPTTFKSPAKQGTAPTHEMKHSKVLSDTWPRKRKEPTLIEKNKARMEKSQVHSPKSKKKRAQASKMKKVIKGIGKGMRVGAAEGASEAFSERATKKFKSVGETKGEAK